MAVSMMQEHGSISLARSIPVRTINIFTITQKTIQIHRLHGFDLAFQIAVIAPVIRLHTTLSLARVKRDMKVLIEATLSPWRSSLFGRRFEGLLAAKLFPLLLILSVFAIRIPRPQRYI
ncbi:hypothetical protein EDC15_101315 [Acetobacter aceti NBRC 14818]|nr:hypothetical protein EDC15_101315 [Acetobacter aceti NBRC 14818]